MAGSGPWVRRGLAGAIAVLMVCQAAIVVVHSRDTARPVSVDVAVERFRIGADQSPDAAAVAPSAGVPLTAAPAAAPSAAAPAVGPDPAAPEQTPARAEATPPEPAATAPPSTTTPTSAAHPAAGVYTYRTDGYERIDALGGRQHDYPAETTITYLPEACGVRVRWAPLEERYDERLLCAGSDGTEMRWFESAHAFFGQKDLRRLVCDPRSVVHPVPATPGQRWSFRCTDERTEAVSESQVVDTTPVTVDGRAVEAVHVQVNTNVTGDSQAESEMHAWLDRESGLVLRQTFALDGTSAGPSGPVAYTERYELQLTSLEPRT